MQSKKLEAIADKSAENLKALFSDHEPDIQRAFQEIGDGKKFTIQHTITLDIEKDAQIDKLTWSMKYSATAEGPLPDPDQLELGIDD